MVMKFSCTFTYNKLGQFFQNLLNHHLTRGRAGQMVKQTYKNEHTHKEHGCIVNSLDDLVLIIDKLLMVFFFLPVPKKSSDVEEPKLENEGTIEEQVNVNISPTAADRKSPTSKTAKVLFIYNIAFELS